MRSLVVVVVGGGGGGGGWGVCGHVETSYSLFHYTAASRSTEAPTGRGRGFDCRAQLSLLAVGVVIVVPHAM